MSAVSFTVLLNGSKLHEFQPSRVILICQGDPISPYLFLVAVEGLSCLLKAHSRNDQVKGVVLAPGAPPVNHLLFADDCLLFFKANEEGANTMEIIQNYCDAFGRRVNLSKSSIIIIFSKGSPNDRKVAIKGILDVPNESLSKRYLGLHSDVGSTSKIGCGEKYVDGSRSAWLLSEREF